MKRLVILVSFLSLSLVGFSQVRAFLDTNVIAFANQTVLHVQVNNKNKTNVFFPEFKGDTIADKVEIVQSLPIDTVKTNPFIIEKKYIITSFEDSLRKIPALSVIVGKDTLLTKPLQFYVLPLKMDSTELAKLDTTQMIPIFGVKKPYGVKFTFKEFWLRFGRWILLGLLILLFVGVIVWIIIRYKNNKPIKLLEKPKEPAHIIAFRRLDELKEKKLFQNNKIKEFYSELTDILRAYIEQRFRIPAMERTSSEIITDFEIQKILENNELKELRALLNISDLAKFAKYRPTPDLCQNNFNQVRDFVDETKEEEQEEKEEEQQENKIDEQKENQQEETIQKNSDK